MQSVIKRNGETVEFNSEKVEQAILKAFISTEGESAKKSSRVSSIISECTNDLLREMSNMDSIHVESIQDKIEKVLMLKGEHKAARSYVIYRENRAKNREETEEPSITVKLDSGEVANIKKYDLMKLLESSCKGYENVSSEKIAKETMRNLYSGATMKEVREVLRITSRAMVEQEPEYSYVTAKLLSLELLKESREILGLPENSSYRDDFIATLNFGVKHGHLNEDMVSGIFDIDALADEIDGSQDDKLTYLSMQTLYDRYVLHLEDVRYERPQSMLMRVAMGLSLNEKNPTEKAIEFYKTLSSFDYMSSTPTLFNSGTKTPQLSSCYLTSVPDDLFGIFGSIQDNAMLSKFAGGLGNSWTNVRAAKSHIKGTNGESQGVVPFLKVVNDTAVAVNQGGKRKGAVCAYLETWHMDIEEFLELRKNTGDDRRRTHDMNSANWIPDLFMKRLSEGGNWTLFSPSDTPDLHEIYGKAFESRYVEYENMAKNGEIKLHKTIKAADLWRKILSMVFETGHPWITFKDPCNIRSPQQHAGVVHSSNLCTEITLNTGPDEIAVCNLGSINIAQHIFTSLSVENHFSDKSDPSFGGRINIEKIKDTVKKAIRMLDNVIDINFYPVEAARNSNMKHRPIGLGIMGLQDALYELRIPYASQDAVDFSDRILEVISYYAIEASHELSVERGSYESFNGSLWSKGILPIDSIEMLRQERGAEYLNMDTSSTMDWDSLRQKASKGMRNSNVMAIAPTATISNICGVTQSFEPTFENLYVKSNLSGDFTVINPYLVNDLKALKLWDPAMLNDLKFYDGAVGMIERIPAELRELYATAFDIEPRWVIEPASRRQKWLDQSQSVNIYISGVSGKKIDLTYRMAWIKGLKTTYYLRATSATGTEKSTVTTGKLNAVKA